MRRFWVVAAIAAWLAAGGPAAADEMPRQAAVAPATLRALRHLPIQHQGRIKPFESFARETLEAVTGAPRYRSQDPVETVLAILAFPEDWQGAPLLAVPYGPLREPLGVGPKATHISYDGLMATRALMRRLPPIVEKQSRDEPLTMLEQETMDAYERFVAFSTLLHHELDLVPPGSPSTREWGPVLKSSAAQPAWGAFMMALRDGAPAATVDTAFRALATALRPASPAVAPAAWKLRLEVLYHHAAPFAWARGLYLVAAALMAFGMIRGRAALTRVGVRAMWAGFALHGLGILTRVAVGGRPPVSNFYETMLWLPFVGLVVALVVERGVSGTGKRYISVAASVLAAIMLILTDHVPLDPSIAPVVAVLRSRLWLTIHVLTIVASYGALAVATVLAHFSSGCFLARRDHPALAPLNAALYRTIQIGVVLLAAGIMLGAVWANASWGRYWGWDPKETWALITLIWFLALLHGRMAGWIRGVGLAAGTILGFFLLLMTYYGVSFYLVGLHSYAGGHAKPLPPLLVGFLCVELALLAALGARTRKGPSASIL
ncbi:MAG: cytochrome c biogenesis protein CcsA [Candidatus Omnitrophica bacterium]|nr:cytochrome c biogenesis protein CcsA [Candidatus Omnitrophota bacterium]